MRINGWQRLWTIVAALAAALLATLVLTSRVGTNMPEQADAYTSGLATQVKTVEIATVGRVDFPDNLSDEEIGRLIKAAMSTSPPTVRQVAAEHLRERANRKAFEAHEVNQAAIAENRQLYVYSMLVWLGFVSIVYILGWAVGWVRRGFRET